MIWNFSQISSLFTDEKSKLLLDGKWGIEREAQRVAPNGRLALSEHPKAFGNKLENTLVTTDFSESQLEMITPPYKSVEETYEYLQKLQDSVEAELGEEMLWPSSMPPELPADDQIPIARFDDSLEGREKEIYRSGLALRYGKKMQMISGIHYNFSFGNEMLEYLYKQFGKGMSKRAFVDDVYFSMARNYLRYRWLLIYLFGASPLADSTYYPVIFKELKLIAKYCPETSIRFRNIGRYATSLRVSRFGYSNSVQGKYSVGYNSLNGYLNGIRRLILKKSRKFSSMGIFQNDRRVQLNDRIIQKESEFYSSIRLKQTPQKGETQLEALEKRGVEYAEVRILDANPFEKTGISLDEMYFLQIFMLFCLFETSDPVSDLELGKINKNHHLVALCGRKDGLKLYKYNHGPILLKEWSEEIFKKMENIASLMDTAHYIDKYRKCLELEIKKLADPMLLPSSVIRKEMAEHGESYLAFGTRMARKHRNYKNEMEVSV